MREPNEPIRKMAAREIMIRSRPRKREAMPVRRKYAARRRVEGEICLGAAPRSSAGLDDYGFRLLLWDEDDEP
jgi:hypothetical protein